MGNKTTPYMKPQRIEEIDGVQQKKCNHCDRWQTLENFYTNKEGKYLLPCKECRREHSKEWRDNNPEKRREQWNRWARKQRTVMSSSTTETTNE